MGNNLNTLRDATLHRLVSRLASLALAALLAPFVAVATPGDIDPLFRDGELSRTIPAGAYLNVIASVLDEASRMVVVRPCTQPDSSVGTCLTRYTSDGNVDTSFGVAGSLSIKIAAVNDLIRGIVLSGGSGYLVYGDCAVDENTRDFCAALIDESGELDPSFGSAGRFTADVDGSPNWAQRHVTRVADGYLFVVACLTKCVIKITGDGQLDHGFGEAGVLRLLSPEVISEVLMVRVTHSSQLIVGARCYLDACVARFNLDGSFDTTFGTAPRIISIDGGSVAIADIRTDAGGNVYILASGLTKLTPNGEHDLSFGFDGVANLVDSKIGLNTIAHVDNDSNFVLAGNCLTRANFPGPDQTEPCISRVFANGIVDFPLANGKYSLLYPGKYGRWSGVGGVHTLQNGKLLFSAICDSVGVSSTAVCVGRAKGFYKASTCTLNADLNNQVAGNDGVLAIRYLLGYTGNALTDGALGANPGRTAQQIESHLAQLKTDGKLDVDGDGEVNAMTDGLLILRAMLGLSGDALVAGARNASHPNVRDAKQILTWIELTHGVACLP
jgi:uncharacterized delta-60 repeat protein